MTTRRLRTLASAITAGTCGGRGSQFSGGLRFRASMLAGATISPGTTARFSVGDGAPRYAAKGEVANLDLQQIGRGFDIEALAADRFRSRVNASFDVTGSGGGRYPLTIDAAGTVVDSELFGASFPTLDFTASLEGGDARVKTAGRFERLDPAVVSGNEKAAGSITGNADVETTIHQFASGVTVDTVPFDGEGEVMTAALGGHIDFMLGNPGEILPQIEAGTLRPLAVSTGARLQSLPDTPTFKELGYNIEHVQLRGVVMPADVPQEAITFWEGALQRVADSEQWKREYLDRFRDEPRYVGSREFGKILESNKYAYGYNAQTGVYGDLLGEGVIDPAKVVRCALQDAASIGGLLITTEAMVAERPEKKAPPAGGPGGGMGDMDF